MRTPTPFESEKKSRWYDCMNNGKHVNKIKTCKYNVAADHQVVLRTQMDTADGRARVGHCYPHYSGDLFPIPNAKWAVYSSLEPMTRLMLFGTSFIISLLVEGVCCCSHDVGISVQHHALLVSAMPLVLYIVLGLIVQEYWYSPSYKTVEYLSSQGLLPSPFSNVDSIDVRHFNESYTLDVHYLHSKGSSRRADAIENGAIDCICCIHGFAASSLSWLPIFRRLADLNVSHILAHDIVGFGLTNRPPVSSIQDLHRYEFSFSAHVGLALLERTLSMGSRTNKYGRIVLIGHSMGALIALRMALELPPITNIQVILVAPSIVGFDSTKQAGLLQAAVCELSKLWGIAVALCQTFFRRVWMVLFEGPLCYFALKRIIACKALWQASLGYCWGDVNPLSEYDVECYRWPSIVKGCVRGSIHFLTAQLFRYGFLSYPGGDIQLLVDVLDRSNVVSVSIIQGSKDRLIPASNARKLCRLFPKVRLEELDGVGHSPIAETPDLFLQTVRRILNDDA